MPPHDIIFSACGGVARGGGNASSANLKLSHLLYLFSILDFLGLFGELYSLELGGSNLGLYH